MKLIKEIAQMLGISEEYLEYYGKYKAKISSEFITKSSNSGKNSKLILVTAMSPTPSGEGKTTISIGLSQALWQIGKKNILCLREPSLGPCFGMKGGATGGGKSSVLPNCDINLHFTGDFAAISTAHNLISACLDNHVYQNNKLLIDPSNIVWKRAIDMNDRSLRNIVIGLGGKQNGSCREDGFIITAASEIMAIICLTTNLSDLKNRLERIIIAYSYNGDPIFVKDLKIVDALVVLLKDALLPNLVQTTEATPVLIHGGPFANIAHGCNSMIATKLAMQISDLVITEAGFGADLGAEKFLNIKCRIGDLKPSCVIIVATIKSLKYQGELEENIPALERGFGNLLQHVENIQKFGLPVIVSLNKFSSDSDLEIDYLNRKCQEKNINIVVSDPFNGGGNGCVQLATELLSKLENSQNMNFTFLYNINDSIEKKIETIATQIYRAKKVEFSVMAKQNITKITKLQLDNLPICIAKTPLSFSDNPKLLGNPRDFTLTITEIRIASGAGFLIAISGETMLMPGLPKCPRAENICFNSQGEIDGLM